jgi:hypothetical protein
MRTVTRRLRRKLFSAITLGLSELGRHLVPLDAALRTADAYPVFVRERRTLLADAMTSLLERFQPEALTTVSRSLTLRPERV